ncbi:MAG: DF family (seleno)protein, partial [Terriglobales bacterium]
MKIEILYVPGCPHLQPAAELVERVLLEEGVRAEVQQVLVADEATAATLRFAGSPTVLVNGRDVEPAVVAGQGGLSCRLYANHGAPGIPSRDAL